MAMGPTTATRIAITGLLALALGAVSPAAQARGGSAGSGVIEDVSVDERTVTVGPTTLSVRARSELRSSSGARLSLADLERSWVGERAAYTSDPGRPHRVLRTLLADDPDSDG